MREARGEVIGRRGRPPKRREDHIADDLREAAEAGQWEEEEFAPSPPTRRRAKQKKAQRRESSPSLSRGRSASRTRGARSNSHNK
eukprot:1589180-Pleurochrysis_carterae.AAC.1